MDSVQTQRLATIARNLTLVEPAPTAKKIYEMMSKVFNQEGPELKNFCDLFSNKSFRILISQRLSELKKRNSVVDRINRIFYNLNYLKKNRPKIPYFPSANNSFRPEIKVSTRQRLSPCLHDSLENFLSILSSKSLCNSFTDFRIKASEEKDCPHALLHEAIQNKDTEEANRLLQRGANSNKVDKISKSAVIKTLEALTSCNLNQNDEIDNLFKIFSFLLEYRKPIQEIELFHLLNQHQNLYKEYQQKYRDKELKTILFKLCDEVASLLLGYEQRVESFLEDEMELLDIYTAHIHHMRGEIIKQVDENKIEKIDLEGLHRDEYMELRLYLLLQIIVQKASKDLTMIYREFLVELEMGWVSQLLYSWERGNLSSDKNLTKEFCKLLSEQYVFNQIVNLGPKEEYPLHVGWPGHSICVAFIRKKNFLTVCIDNLGEGSEREHKGYLEDGSSHVYPKMLRTYSIDNVISNEEISKKIKKYLTSLFFLCSFKYPKSADREKFIRKVYNSKLPKGLLLPQEDIPSPNPAQVVGNCTFASFAPGAIRRLGSELDSWIFSKECKVIRDLKNMYLTGKDLTQFVSRNFIQIEDTESYFSGLKIYLNEEYKLLIPKSSEIPCIMESELVDLSNKQKRISLTSLTQNLHSKKLELVRGQWKQVSKSQILIEGAPGQGKTVFSAQFSQQLHEKKSNIVVYLRLRNLSNEHYPNEPNIKYTLIDIINQEIFKKRLNSLEKKLLTYQLACPTTIWVLDGLDELNRLPQLEKPIEKLFKKNKLVVTSRRGANHPANLKFNERLSLCDYDQKEINKFIDAYLSKPSLKTSKETIKKAITSNPHFQKLCSVPLTLLLICKLAKDGDEEFSSKKNLAELYRRAIASHLKEAYKRQNNSKSYIPDYKIRDSYKTAVNFMQRLSYESLKNSRNVSPSQKTVESVIQNQKINLLPDDKRFFYEELKTIGLLEISSDNAEFAHPTFQEYFAACFLIKLLKNPEKTTDSESPNAFIEKHASDLKYENIFSFIMHQLIFLISEEKKQKDEGKFNKLLSDYMSHFVKPVRTKRNHRKSDIFVQGISLLNSYINGLDSKLIIAENFILSYKGFIEESFQFILFHNLYPDSLNNQLAALFLAIPILKEQLKVKKCLIENIKADSDDIADLACRTMNFIDSIEELDWSTLVSIQSIALKISNPKEKFNVLVRLLEITLDRIKKFDNNPFPSHAKNLLDQQLSNIISNEISLKSTYNCTKKVIDCLDLLSNQDKSFPGDKALGLVIKKHLPNYVSTMFAKLCVETPDGAQFAYEDLIDYSRIAKNMLAECQKLIKMQPLGLSLETIFCENKIQPFKDMFNKDLNEASIRKGKETDIRRMYLSDISFTLEHFLPIIDFVNSNDGTDWFTQLFQLHKTGGACPSKGGKASCRHEVREIALRGYKPYVHLSPNFKYSLDAFKLFYQRIFNKESPFHNNFASFCNLYNLKEKQKLLAWLEKLHKGYPPEQNPHHQEIKRLCQELQGLI